MILKEVIMDVQTMAEIGFGILVLGIVGLGIYSTYLEKKGFEKSIRRYDEQQQRKQRILDQEEESI